MEAKYIVGELPGDFGTILAGIIFPTFMNHKHVAFKLDIHPDNILGAGFCRKGDTGKFHCYGKSESLEKKSRGDEDSWHLNKLGVD